jgi:hypothetical protein
LVARLQEYLVEGGLTVGGGLTTLIQALLQYISLEYLPLASTTHLPV